MKIKYGTNRIVFIFNKIVIKIPNFKYSYENFLTGILANLQEKRFSGLHKDLAKVKYCHRSGLFLIMEKIGELPLYITFELLHIKLDRKYRNDELREFLFSDFKKENWGYVYGRSDTRDFVKIDYGS